MRSQQDNRTAPSASVIVPSYDLLSLDVTLFLKHVAHTFLLSSPSLVPCIPGPFATALTADSPYLCEQLYNHRHQRLLLPPFYTVSIVLDYRHLPLVLQTWHHT